MEEYVAVTGPGPHVDLWESDLRAVKIPHKWGKDQEEKGYIRFGVHPIRLYKLVFPKDKYEEVQKIIGIPNKENYVLKRYKRLKIFAGVIRKLLGLKKPVVPKEVDPLMQPYNRGKSVAVVPIGSKEDMTCSETGCEML